jgi:N-acetylglucosaminyl-diphospho-decaprenol L-rhamnosyltransferase
MTRCDLSIIIVSWNVDALLRGCLMSLEELSSPLSRSPNQRQFGPKSDLQTLEVLVVDNASQDNTCAMVRAEFPWVRLIASETNLGFTAGNNLGYAASRGRFVYFLNPDTVVDNRPARDLWTLYQAIRKSESIGMVGPELRYGDGVLQSSARRFPQRLTAFFESTWLGRSWPANPWSRTMHMADWSVNFPHDVDWLVGAAMLARRRALEDVRMPGMAGPFDEGFFMYSEELDLCWRLKLAGWRVVYVPTALVTHYEGRSSEQVVAARHIHFNTSRVRLYDKYFGRRWANLLRHYLLVEYRWQLWSERLKRLLGSKPALRTARIDAYKQVLASKLRPDSMREAR